MEETTFDSSDSCRHARPLKYVQSVAFEEPMRLERDGIIPKLTVAYETYGQLNAARDNAVLICHALTGDSHVARHDAEDDPGWWDIMVGPGKPVDTDRYFVICPNILGGCRGTTGPNSINPETGKPYGADFPLITIGDIVEVQCRLIDHLGIDRLLGVMGGSLGGHMALEWGKRFPDRLRSAVAIATSAHLTSQALAFDVVGRNAILRDPDYHDGQYYDKRTKPLVGLAIARMLGHITYLSREAMMSKFGADRLQARDIQTDFETRFSVGSYLAYQGDRFGERFDPNSYLALTMAIDLFELGADVEQIAANLSQSQCRWLVLSFTSDWLFPPFQSRELVDALIAKDKPVTYCNVTSEAGHDAFLLPQDLDSYGELIRLFLYNTEVGRPGVSEATDEPPLDNARPDASLIHSPKSIFHRRHRLDYDTIVGLIPPNASVLDLGCGTGGLLVRLRQRGHRRIMGVEWDQNAILTCVGQGVDVVQADLNEGLTAFVAEQFDFVLLSQTLQTVMDVEQLLDEMLRVGRRAIVSFPNLGYYRLRSEMAEHGRSPRGDAQEGFHWYNTPNVRSLTIRDFQDLCRAKGYTIHHEVWLDTEANCRVEEDPNLKADVAIVVLSS